MEPESTRKGAATQPSTGPSAGPDDAVVPRRGTKRRVGALPLLVLLLTLAGLALSVVEGLRSQARLRAEPLAQAEQRATQLADAMAGQVDSLLRLLDVSLLALRDEWSADAAAIDPVARKALTLLPPGAVSHFSAVDAEGYIAYSTAPPEGRLYVGDRAHQLQQRDGSDRLRVGAPYRARVGTGWSLVVNRPMLNQGRPAGTVNFIVDVAYMSELLARLKLSSQDVVGLVHAQGTVAAHSREPNAVGRMLPADRPFFADAAVRQGVFRTTSAIDGVNRTVAWKRIDDFGLAVAVGLADDNVLAPLAEVEARGRVVGGLLLAGFGLFGVGLAVLLWQAERRQARVAESEAFRQHVFDGLHTPIIVMDPASGRFIDGNAAAVECLRLGSRDQLLGHELVGLAEPVQPGGRDAPEQLREHVGTALAQGSSLFELRMRHPDGSPWDAEVHLMGFHDGGRRALQFTLRDITAEKAAQTQLRLLRHAVDHSRDAVYWIDADRRVLDVNAQACRSLGRTREELVGLSVAEIDPDFRPELHARYYEQLDRTESILFESRHRRKDGTTFPVEVLASRTTYEGRRSIFTFVRDITERKAAEHALVALNESLEQRVAERTRELAAAKEEAERASQAKSEFLSRMSHELRTPLNAVLGFGQLLEMKGLDERSTAHVKEILRAGQHLLALIDEVLDLARVESGTLTVSPEPVALLPVVQDCLALLQPQAMSRDVHLLETSHLCDVHVRADRTRIKQVLLNLLSNAIKYNRSQGSVSVVCAREVVDGEAQVVVRVNDTGAGLTPAQCARLFMPFERLDAAERRIEGTGIGLALSRRLVELMQGSIGVESVPGSGSTFWVRLPVANAPVPIAGLPGRDAPAAGAITARVDVLCIEDNPANLRLIEGVFAHRPDIRLISAIAPSLGLELARTHRPALILLDINLPDMDGYAVMQCLRESEATRGIPVIAISANAMPRDIERGKAAGFVDYLTKPLDVRRLVRIVEEVCGRARRG